MSVATATATSLRSSSYNLGAQTPETSTPVTQKSKQPVLQKIKDCLGMRSKEKGKKVSTTGKKSDPVLTKVFFEKVDPINEKTKMALYENVSKGLATLKEISDKYHVKYEKVNGKAFFSAEQIESLEDLKPLCNKFINSEKSDVTIISPKSVSEALLTENVILMVNDIPYLLLSNAVLGKGGTKDRCIAGINLDTGDCEAITVSQSKSSDTETIKKIKLMPKTIYEKLVKIAAKNGNEGGVLPLKGMINIPDSMTTTQVIVQELCPYGSLEDLMNAGTLTNEEELKIIKVIAKFLESFKEEKLYHGDLRRDNIGIKYDKLGNLIVYVFDFDRTVELSTPTPIGCLPFTAPEVLLGDGPTDKTDMWSFGLLAFAVVWNKEPAIVNKLKNMLKQEEENRKNKIDVNIRPKSVAEIKQRLETNYIPEDLKTNFSKFLRLILTDERTRLSADQIVKHVEQLTIEDLQQPMPKCYTNVRLKAAERKEENEFVAKEFFKDIKA